ncbi:MAG: DUF2332 domain-containing protein [Jatrophihabitantaceae bacterium]
MPDWIGTDQLPTAARYRAMAERETRGISASYEAICLGIAGDAAVLARLDELPAPKRQPNLLLGATRLLDGPTGSYPQFRDWLLATWDDLAATMLARRTQTNEPNRCATLLPVLATLPQPLALLEVGASAGLCLYPDRYSYRWLMGDEDVVAGMSEPQFPCAVTGPAPLPGAPVQVVWRAGLDLHPLDVRSEQDVRWLEALVWPEQLARRDRLRAAVSLVRRDPPRIVQGDLLSHLPALAAEAPPSATLVVFHSAVLAYVPPAGRVAFTAQLRRLLAERRAAWLSNEAPGVLDGTALDTGGRSRFVLAHDGRPLALTGPHGQSLDWLT